MGKTRHRAKPKREHVEVDIVRGTRAETGVQISRTVKQICGFPLTLYDS